MKLLQSSSERCSAGRTLLLLARWLGCAAALTGCFPSGPDFSPPRRVLGVRVLAVTSAPASGVPGERAELQLEAYDARQHPGLATAGSDAGADAGTEMPAPLTVAWLGGCHNPPGDVHFGCYPLLQRIAAALPSRLPASAAEVPVEQREFWGVGSRFAATIPEDVLEGRQLDTNALPFGVSFVFFAVCRGHLLPAPDVPNDVPLRCESDDGEPVDSEGFVSGFATLYTYAGSVNRAPVISAKITAGRELPEPACASDSDCAPLASGALGSVCRSPLPARISGEPSAASSRCMPSVQRCVAPPCPSYELWPLLAAGSVEPDLAAAPPGGRPPSEVIWVKYYGLGGLSEGQALINDRASGLSPSYSTRWTPPPFASAAPLPVWAVVQDNRGGASVARWDFVVTD